jgi:hypothetical protein
LTNGREQNDIVVKKPPGPSSDNSTLLTDVSVSDARSILRDSSIISSLRNSSVYAFQSIRSLFLSSELPPHVSRIRWTCHCGHQSHDDFISERRVVKTIADRMISSGIKAEIVTWRESGISTLLSILKSIALSRHRRYAGNHRESTRSAPGNLQAGMNLSAAARNSSQGGQDDTQDISQVGLESTDGEPIKEVKDKVRFLHLCIHMESPLPHMDPVTIDPKSAPAKTINCDQQLFREIKKRYLKARERRITVFTRLKGIYFVQVSRTASSLGSSSSPSVIQRPVPHMFTGGWMLLCTAQKTTVSISHMELPRRLTDKELFHALRRKYEQKRPPWLLKLRLRAVTQIRIVHVSPPPRIIYVVS